MEGRRRGEAAARNRLARLLGAARLPASFSALAGEKGPAGGKLGPNHWTARETTASTARDCAEGKADRGKRSVGKLPELQRDIQSAHQQADRSMR